MAEPWTEADALASALGQRLRQLSQTFKPHTRIRSCNTCLTTVM